MRYETRKRNRDWLEDYNDLNREEMTVKTKIVGIDIPAWDLICFMVKTSFCAIPATILIMCIWMLIGTIFSGMI